AVVIEDARRVLGPAGDSAPPASGIAAGSSPDGGGADADGIGSRLAELRAHAERVAVRPSATPFRLRKPRA
ncbi:MAG: hypothetical protein AAF235_08840, partial [Planctomycetota bacterium]